MAKLGGWLSTSDPIVAEAVARAGFDFVGLDLQHGGYGLAEAARTLQVIDLVGIPSLVRLSSEELGTLPRYLDFGATAVMVATVDGPAIAERAVRLTRHQPDGDRSDGGSRRFSLAPADGQVASVHVWSMIETRAGLDSVDEIAGVPGLYGLAVGPADLARALGVPWERRLEDQSWCDAVDRVLEVARAASLASCIFAASGADAAGWSDHGFDHVVLSNDLDLLRSAMRRELLAGRNGQG